MEKVPDSAQPKVTPEVRWTLAPLCDKKKKKEKEEEGKKWRVFGRNMLSWSYLIMALFLSVTYFCQKDTH